MAQLEIIDREAWRRVVDLQKAIVHIGSSAQNDVVLEPARGAGVAARHLQLISAPGAGLGYRLVNLGDDELSLGPDRRLPSLGSLEIGDGDRLQVGEYVIVFRAGAFGGNGGAVAVAGGAPLMAGRAPAARGSGLIGLRLTLPTTELSPDRPIEGAITVANLGDKSGVQFRLEVTGLDAGSYEVGPGPILFPNAQKDVYLRLEHPRQPKPPAGDHRITICASAPIAYPGESTSVTQVLRILPYYDAKLTLVAQE